jgi:MYXO-CTERM domain-containing protein
MRFRFVTRAAAVAALLPGVAAADAFLLDADGSGVATPIERRVTVELYEQVATTVVELTFEPGELLTSAGSSGDAPIFVYTTPADGSVVAAAFKDGDAWIEASVGATDMGALPVTPPDGFSGALPSGAGALGESPSFGENPFWLPIIDTRDDGGRIVVRLTTLEIAPYEGGEVRWRYPLAPPTLIGAGAAQSVFDVRVETGRPLVGWSVPSHAAEVVETTRGARALALHLETRSDDRDLELRYGVRAEEDVYLRLLTAHERCTEDGFFLLVVEPRQDVTEGEAVAKDFTFVVDTSGSMDGYKMTQAIEATRTFVAGLNARDRFDLVTFSDDAYRLFGEQRVADAASRGTASRHADSLYASGGTNIDAAVRAALDSRFDPERARFVVLLTDGMPTVGETNTEALRRNVLRANENDVRLFAFGVGDELEVDFPFLRALATENRGDATLVSPHADIAGLLKAFFDRIDRPVLTDVRLDIAGVEVFDGAPELLEGETTDLFAGSQLFLLGRYRDGGPATITLEGQEGGAARAHRLEVDFPVCAEGQNPFLPRLWAKARIDALLDRIAREGETEALVAEVEALSLRYGVQSPYTSFGVSRPVEPASGDSGEDAYGSYDGSNDDSYGSYDGSDGYSSGAPEDGLTGCSTTAVRGQPGFGLLGLLAVGLLRRRRSPVTSEV